MQVRMMPVAVQWLERIDEPPEQIDTVIALVRLQIRIRLRGTELTDNAARHCRANVAIGLATADGHVTLTVEDDGDGIPRAERERVFERFVRLDEARARDAGGSGLGLAIVQGIAATAAGTASVDESRWGGARVTVTLPAAS